MENSSNDGNRTVGDKTGDRSVGSVSGAGAVLVVEPSRIVARGVLRAVDGLGVRCLHAVSVPSALGLLESENPSAVIASNELVGMPAGSLFAALRASPRHRSIPLAMMTGSMGLAPVSDCPVFAKSPSLGSEIAGWLASLGIGDRAGRPLTLDGVRLLVAEDAASMRRLLSHKLRLRGALVSLAEDGVEAGVLGLRERFDAIVLDIEMPRLDGRDACRMFRDAGITVPIVALTAHDDPATVSSLGDECGFDAVIPKSDAIPGFESFWASFRAGRDAGRARSVA